MIIVSEGAIFNLSCAWNRNIAVASQNGFMSVYNIHSRERLYQFGSTEVKGNTIILNAGNRMKLIIFSSFHAKQQDQKDKRAVGCIQFAYGEHLSNIYIVDTRTLRTRHIIRLSHENEDYAITGLTFSPNSAQLYIDIEDRLVELKIDVSGQFGGSSIIPF